MNGERMRTMAVTVLLVLLAVGAGAPRAAGFGTVEGKLGQKSEHEKITRAALHCPGGGSSDGSCFEPLALDRLAGTNKGLGDVGAVGEPDKHELLNSAAHCDDADFLATPGYPQSRREATDALFHCIAHLGDEFSAAVQAADEVVSGDPPTISAWNTSIAGLDACFGRAKCSVIHHFGKALHGVQDFHSHSNWNDRWDPNRDVGVKNPPGLDRQGAAPFLNLRWPRRPSVPPNLATGCWPDWKCRLFGRITHGTLNKDKGTIKPVSGAASDAKTPRGKLYDSGNFKAAVRGAIDETKVQWGALRGAIIHDYGRTRGALMICAITHDDPVNDCQGRSVAIVVDSSGSNEWTDPSNLRIAAAAAFNSSLVSQADVARTGLGVADRSAVISFSSSASVLSPLGDPDAASFTGIGAFGGTCIACGVSAAHSLLAAEAGGSAPFSKSGIVVLTDGEDEDVSAIIDAIRAAASVGIRTSIGFLSPPPNPIVPRAGHGPASLLEEAAFEPDPDLVAAVQDSGGVAATIASAEAQGSFVEVALANGLTAVDDPNGNDDGGALAAGVQVRGRIDPPGDTDTWTYLVSRGQPVRIALVGPDTTMLVRDARTGRRIDRAKVGSSGSAGVVVGGARQRSLEIVVSAGRGQTSEYQLGVTPVDPAQAAKYAKAAKKRRCRRAKAAKRTAQRALTRAKRHHSRSVRRKAARVRHLKRKVRKVCS